MYECIVHCYFYIMNSYNLNSEIPSKYKIIYDIIIEKYSDLVYFYIAIWNIRMMMKIMREPHAQRVQV